MGGQIVDASIIAAPKQRNTDAEKRDIKEGRIPAGWADKPAKLAQKDRDARWTVKWSKAKPADDGSSRIDLAVPAFGYKNHVGIDRRHGLIRTWTVTDAARHDGAQLPGLIPKANTGSDVWGDTAYRSRANERLLAENGRRSQIHRKKPPRKPMPKHTARANGAKSKVRAAVEHVFAHEKGPMGLVVRTIGLARARVKIRACQPRLQHEANDLAHRPSRPGIGGRRRQDAGPTPIAGSQATGLAFSRAEPTRAHPSRQGSWRCPASPAPARQRIANSRQFGKRRRPGRKRDEPTALKRERVSGRKTAASSVCSTSMP